MSDELYTERREFILRSMDDIEQRRMSNVTIRYFTDNQAIEIEIRSWKRRKNEEGDEY